MNPLEKFNDWLVVHEFKDLRDAEHTVKEGGKRIMLRGIWAATFLANGIRQATDLMIEGYDLAKTIGLVGSFIIGVVLIFVGIRESEKVVAAVNFIKLAIAQQNFGHGRKFGEGRTQ